jgi:hypothetical protein
MFERWKFRRAQRLSARDLSRLDGHMLRDIGLEADQFRDPHTDRATTLVLTQHPRRN